MTTTATHRRAAVAQLALVLATALAASACSVHRIDDDASLEARGDDTAAPGARSGTVAEPGAVVESAPGDAGGEPGDAGAEPGDATGGPAGDATGATGADDSAAPAREPTANDAGATPREASDQGVTTDEIRLGILHTSDAFFAAAGQSTKNVNRVIAPFIKEINDSGGIHGRKVLPKISTYDPLSADSMKAACVEQAEDYKVFSSIAQIGFYGDAEICMASKQIPLLTYNNSTEKTNVERERGWVRQTNQNKDRNMKNWIDWMVDSGLLAANVKTGLLYVDVPEDRDLVHEVVLPYLESKGLPRPELATLSASIAQTPSESQSAVLRFKSENVQLVLPLVSFLRILIFAEQAEAAAYRPEYSVSDFGLLSTDAMSGMPPEQWEGVRGITIAPTGIVEPGHPPNSAAFADCHRVYRKYGEEFEPHPDDPSRPEPLEVAMVAHYCQHLALWADVARRAGVNPTRPAFLQAFDATGTWSHRVLLSERLTYGPGKLDGADLFAVVEWRSGCTSDGGCYRQVEGFRQGRW